MEVRRMPTGSRSLDRLLGGGVSTRALTLLYGETGTGKTALALSVASVHLRDDRAAKVIYIDSDAKFSPTRFTQMTGSELYLKRLYYIKPTSFEAQAEALDKLPDQIDAGDLVVLDSVTGLYRVETGDTQKTFQENKELNRQLGQIKEIALTERAAMVYTGQVRSILDSPVPAVEPVAPRLLRYWSDVVVKLEHTPTQGVKQASVEKPVNRRGATRIKITERGVVDEER